jgi:hypothetical protein
MDIETAALGTPKPEATAPHLVDELLAGKAEVTAQKRALVVSLNQLTQAVRNAREQLEDHL